MSANALRPVDAKPDFAIVEQVIIKGDLARLSAEERADYYMRVCTSVGLNPFTKPLEYILLNGKLTLYALKGATDQLRDLHGISIIDTRTEYIDELIVVTVTGENAKGRRDSEIGAVAIAGLKGEAKANAMMKALTKAKRRLSLSMCGLGMLDETEVETIPSARAYTERPPVEVVDRDTGEITASPPEATEDPETREKANKAVFAIGRERGLAADDIKTIAYAKYTVDSMTKLSIDTLREYYRFLNAEDTEGLQNELYKATQTTTDAEYTELPS